jgi:hypothetical protein
LGKAGHFKRRTLFDNVSRQVRKKSSRTNLGNQLAMENPASKGLSIAMDTRRELQMTCLQTSTHRAFILKDSTQTSITGSPVA